MIFPPGALKRLYIDRDAVKRFGANAKPWVVELHQAGVTLKFRGTGVIFLFAQGVFDIAATPCIWIETYESVELTDGEACV